MDESRGSRQEERIEQLKAAARRAAGGQVVSWESPELSGEQREDFWRRVIACEDGPETTLFKELTDAGVPLPEPDAVREEDLECALWRVILALGRMNVFFDNTDHLSDRALYERLWRDTLRESMPVLDADPNSAWHIDLLGTGSEEDTSTYLRYFADEKWRQHWSSEFPDYPMPEAEEPPHDRDRLLPRG